MKGQPDASALSVSAVKLLVAADPAGFVATRATKEHGRPADADLARVTQQLPGKVCLLLSMVSDGARCFSKVLESQFDAVCRKQGLHNRTE